MYLLRRFAFAALAFATLAAPAAARATAPDAPDADLIRLLFPGLRGEPAEAGAVYGPTAIPVRRLGAGEIAAVLDGVTGVRVASSVTVPDDTSARRVLYLRVTGETVAEDTIHPGETALMAVYDAAPSPRLLDVVDVQTDRDVEVSWDGPASQLGPRTRAVVVHNEHHNSSQTYHAYTILYVHGGRLRTLTEIPLLSWRGCAEEVNERPSFRLRSRRGSSMRDLVVTVTVARRRGPGCGAPSRVRPSTRAYTQTYAWRGPERGYVDAGGTLDRVTRLNDASS
jgi:hypothetical protein